MQTKDQNAHKKLPHPSHLVNDVSSGIIRPILGLKGYVDQLLIQLTMFQCILKGQAEGDAEKEKDH